MQRDLQNLERLCRKMQDRYGSEDDLVLQLKRDLASRTAMEWTVKLAAQPAHAPPPLRALRPRPSISER